MDKHEALILLVEDEATLRFVVEKQLQRLGYKVSGVAENGLVAVEKVLARRYHVVFMDVRLPEIDGITATQRIRAEENSRGVHTTIVGVTAFAEKQRCLQAGMDDFLQKPVLLEHLDAILQKWLNVPNTMGAHTDSADLKHFSETDEKLREIEQKIVLLRKRAGLKQPN